MIWYIYHFYRYVLSYCTLAAGGGWNELALKVIFFLQGFNAEMLIQLV